MNERILYVDADEDIRETMRAFLEREGFAVSVHRTAESALEALDRGSCDLILTDYDLPGKNAGWLIEAAAARGHPRVIVISADDSVRALLPENTFLRKPVRTDVLLAAIDGAIRPRLPSSEGAAIDLVLYVSTPSDASDAARRNLERILRSSGLGSRVHLVVHDMGAGDEAVLRASEEDRIIVVPTLVRRSPLPKIWIAGDLSKRDYVAGLLAPGA